MSYRQLSLDERYQLQTLLRQGFSNAQIARLLQRSPSTVAERAREAATIIASEWGDARTITREDLDCLFRV